MNEKGRTVSVGSGDLLGFWQSPVGFPSNFRFVRKQPGPPPTASKPSGSSLSLRISNRDVIHGLPLRACPGERSLQEMAVITINYLKSVFFRPLFEQRTRSGKMPKHRRHHQETGTREANDCTNVVHFCPTFKMSHDRGWREPCCSEHGS
jgi:hypothetical protein